MITLCHPRLPYVQYGLVDLGIQLLQVYLVLPGQLAVYGQLDLFLKLG